jgi:hypothetical protein
MATTSSSPSFSSSSSSDTFTPTEWTQHNMLSDLMQQKNLLIGAGIVIGALFLFRRRSAPEEKAARRLVRNIRKVDDADDVRSLLGDNLPTIVRPALMIALGEIERQVHQLFRKLEREIEHL